MRHALLVTLTLLLSAGGLASCASSVTQTQGPFLDGQWGGEAGEFLANSHSLVLSIGCEGSTFAGPVLIVANDSFSVSGVVTEARQAGYRGFKVRIWGTWSADTIRFYYAMQDNSGQHMLEHYHDEKVDGVWVPTNLWRLTPGQHAVYSNGNFCLV